MLEGDIRIWQASGVVRWGVVSGGLLWFWGSVAWSWAEILSWMLVVASDPGAGLGIGLRVFGVVG